MIYKEDKLQKFSNCFCATFRQEASIARSRTYLQSHLQELDHAYAVAITVYCLAACLPKGTDHSSNWAKLQELAKEGMSNQSK